MGNVSFPDRFDLLELLHEDDVQTFRARERATGRTVEAHLSASPELLAKLESLSVLDRGSYEGKFYVVTTPQSLESAGAWRILPDVKPLQNEPGDFTRMFELRQGPEPVAAPSSSSPGPKPAPDAASQPGEFTRVFQKPAVAPSAAPAGSPAPGQPGEFTRMFQKPALPAVPPVPEPASQPIVTGSSAPARVPVAVVVIGIVLLSAIAVFVLMRTLY